MKSRERGSPIPGSTTELIKIAEATRAPLLPPTVPLYQGEKRGTPQLVGSGVLVTLADMRFLLTAGHVLDLHANGQLVVAVSPELLSLAGEPMRLRSVGSKGTSGDKIDIGVVRLQGGPWDELSMDRFLTWDWLDTEIPILARQSYALVGFPNSMNRSSPIGATLMAKAISIAGLECTADAYEQTATDPGLNVMIGLEKNAVWAKDGQRSAPDLYGASGCGLWRYGRRIRDSEGPPKLSAIGIEWHHTGQHPHILGTRVTFVLRALADKYDQVRAVIAAQ